MLAVMRVVLFDFDGTLVDSLDVTIAAYNRIAPRYRLKPILREELPRIRKLSARAAMQEHRVTFWKLPWIMRSMRSALHEHIDTLEPFAGIPSTLRALATRSHRLGILSSNSTRNIRRFLVQNDLELFEHVEGGSSMLGKARLLRKLMARHSLDPQGVLYVGDEARDIEAAHAAGVQSVAVSWGYADRAALAARTPTHLVDRPEDLLSLLT